MDINPVVIIVLVIAIVAVCLPIAWYNKLVRLRQLIRESWGNVDVQLKRRYDLIPNLVNTVQGYATHERETLATVTERSEERLNSSHANISYAVFCLKKKTKIERR